MVVYYVVEALVVTAVDGAAPPVIHHVVDEIERTGHSDRCVTADVRGEEVAVEHAVVAADSCSESVAIQVESLRENAVLDGNVHRGQLQVLSAAVVHVAVHRHVLVAAPAARAMVDDDIAYTVATESVVTEHHVGIVAAEAHVAYDDVVGVDKH